jgi:hypothetical protein
VAIKGELVELKITERRSGFDRREFSYSVHAPEKRSGEERRGSASNIIEGINRNKRDLQR